MTEEINENLILMMSKHVNNVSHHMVAATEEMDKARHCLAQAIGLEQVDQIKCKACGYSGPEHVERPLSVCPSCESGYINIVPSNTQKA